jgi:hypothetical protein
MVFEERGDLCHSLTGPVEEVDLHGGAGSFLEAGDEPGSEGRGVSIYGNDRVLSREEECGGNPFGPEGSGTGLFSDEVVKGFPPAMGGESFKGDNAFLCTPCKTFPDDE